VCVCVKLHFSSKYPIIWFKSKTYAHQAKLMGKKNLKSHKWCARPLDANPQVPITISKETGVRYLGGRHIYGRKGMRVLTSSTSVQMRNCMYNTDIPPVLYSFVIDRCVLSAFLPHAPPCPRALMFPPRVPARVVFSWLDLAPCYPPYVLSSPRCRPPSGVPNPFLPFR